MNEIHGYDRSDGMEVDESDGKKENPDYDFLYGSSGPCILEEY